MAEQESKDGRQCSGCGCDLVRVVLGELSLSWPVAMDLDPAAVGVTEDARHQEFARLMQALLDQGFITYEGLERKAGVPRFLNALITPSGRSALKVMRFLATLA
jgi:hypothetical protein